MRAISRASFVTASTLGALVLAVAAQAEGGEKVLVCHGTASPDNPYVLIDVSVDALQGHFDGTAPGHGWNNAPDMLFDPAYGTCEAQAAGGGGGPE